MPPNIPSRAPSPTIGYGSTLDEVREARNREALARQGSRPPTLPTAAPASGLRRLASRPPVHSGDGSRPRVAPPVEAAVKHRLNVRPIMPRPVDTRQSATTGSASVPMQPALPPAKEIHPDMLRRVTERAREFNFYPTRDDHAKALRELVGPRIASLGAQDFFGLIVDVERCQTLLAGQRGKLRADAIRALATPADHIEPALSMLLDDELAVWPDIEQRRLEGFALLREKTDPPLTLRRINQILDVTPGTMCAPTSAQRVERIDESGIAQPRQALSPGRVMAPSARPVGALGSLPERLRPRLWSLVLSEHERTKNGVGAVLQDICAVHGQSLDHRAALVTQMISADRSRQQVEGMDRRTAILTLARNSPSRHDHHLQTLIFQEFGQGAADERLAEATNFLRDGAVKTTTMKSTWQRFRDDILEADAADAAEASAGRSTTSAIGPMP